MRYAALAFTLLANIASADPAIIKSGEHSNFSRLVIYSNEISTWTIQKGENYAKISFDNYSGNFDPREIFKFIPRKRLKSIRTTESDLELFLECKCIVKTETIVNVGLLIDIEDAPASQSTSIRSLTMHTSNEKFRKDLYTEKSYPFKNLKNKLKTAIDERFPPPPNTPPKIPRITNFLAAKVDKSQSRIRTSPSIKNLNTYTTELRQEGAYCPRVTFTYSQGWATDLAYGEYLGNIRKDLHDVQGLVNERELLNLAKFYLAFALTSEARNVLEVITIPTHKSKFLLAVTDLLEGSHSPTSDKILNTCDKENSIWKFLSNPVDKFKSKKETEEIVSQFLQLPQNLRNLMTEKMIHLLEERDATQYSQIISNSTQISKISKNTTSSEITLPKWDNLSRDQLFNLIEKKDIRSLRAIRVILERTWTEREKLSIEQVLFLKSHLFEIRGQTPPADIEIGFLQNDILTNDIEKIKKSVSSLHHADNLLPAMELLTSEILSSQSSHFISTASIYLSKRERLSLVPKRERADIAVLLNNIGLKRLAYSFDPINQKIAQDEAILRSQELKITPPNFILNKPIKEIEISQSSRKKIKQLISKSR